MMKNQNDFVRRAAALLFCVVALSACAPTFSSAPSETASSIGENLGCQAFEDKLWTALAREVELRGRPPTADELEAALARDLKTGKRLKTLSKSGQSILLKSASGLMQTIASRAPVAELEDGTGKTTQQVETTKTQGYWLKRLAKLEIGDRTSAEKSADVDSVRAQIAAMKQIALNEGLTEETCLPDSPTSGQPSIDPASPPRPSPATASGTLLESWKSNEVPAVYGGLRTLAMLYQSCEAGAGAPLSSANTPVEGIKVVGRHENGAGNQRIVSDKKALLNSHPYLNHYKRPQPSCFDVESSPPIYDYGGKPYTTASNEQLLDLSRDAGTGTNALGIDCSAFVYTAYAAAGLKMKSETKLKASLVHGVSSTMLMRPKENGLSCLDHAPFSQQMSLKAGDLIAQAGHVVMVESTGRDPFGIAGIGSIEDCRAAKISVAKFDFVIMQSAPTFGGIGTHRVNARNYFTASSTMGRGLIQHAVNACKAKFTGTTAKSIDSTGSASVIRHLGTAKCVDPELRFSHDQCLSACRRAS